MKRPLRHGSLFSGIGGFDLAAEWVGWENVFHCEIGTFPRTILNYYWPNAKSYEDITKTDFSVWRGGCDVLTGGFPCQPFSHAGNRKGTSDDRYLWPEYLRAIREIAPAWVVGENVAGLVSMDGGKVLEGILTDLEDTGYRTEVFLIPAAGVEGVHRRDRIWIVGELVVNPDSIGMLHGSRGVQGENEEVSERDDSSKPDYAGNKCSTPNPSGIGCGGGNIGPKTDSTKEREICKEVGQDGDRVRGKIEGCSAVTADPESAGLKTRLARQEEEEPRRGDESAWPRLRDGFPSEPPVCGPNDALPKELDGITFSRWKTESLKGYGNAIVPSIAYELFAEINNIYDPK